MKIETKIAKNGVKLYYVDGKRTSREVALQAAADNRENLFTIEYPIPRDPYFMGRILIAGANVYESTSKAVLKELELKIDEYHGFAVQLHTIGWVEICKLFNKDYAKSLINKIENAFIRGEYGVKIDKYGKVSILPAPVIEPNPDDYAVTEDAFQVAVNAEIQAANNVKINDLKWEIRYVEGSINDLDKNHIAHFPQDQSLQERRVELVNELAALNAQLADLLPNEIQVADNEAPKFKYYLQSRRPIAGAVPNGYISATQGEMKVHSLRSDGSISPVPRKVVFGVVVYDHPLSDQQIINYDLHVDPLNPKVEPDNTELAEIEPANTHEADHITGIKEDNVMTIKGQADFLADKIKRECASIDDSTTDRDEVFNLLPDLDNDVEKVWLTKGELDDLTAKFRAAVSIIPVTTRIEKGLPLTIKITKQNSVKPFDMGFGAFAKYSIVQWRTGLRIMRSFSTLGIYDTPAQIEKVIDLLKAAITRGDKAFTFPTVDELIDPPELPPAKPRTLRNSINRAIKQCIRNRIGYLKSHNSKMEKYEYELLYLLQGARRELEIA